MANKIISLEITRPANTTAYAPFDVVSNVATALLVFTGAALEVGGAGYITKARMMTNNSAFVAALSLHLFNNSAITPIADNALFTQLYVNAASRQGQIDFPAATTQGTGSDAAASEVTPGVTAPGGVPMAFVCGANANLYGVLVTPAGFTPTSAQKFWIELTADLNIAG